MPRGPETALAVTAGQWLGRDPETGQTRALRPVPGVAMDRLVEITAEPRLYGFHGTLKAPIALADDVTERDFLAAVGRLRGERPRLRDSRARACRDLGLSRPRAGGALHRTPGPGRPLRRGVRRIPPACKRGRAGAKAGRRPDAAPGRAAAALGLSLCAGAMAVSSHAHRAPARRVRTLDDGRTAAPALRRFHRPSAAGQRPLRLPSARSGTTLRACWRASGSAADVG